MQLLIKPVSAACNMNCRYCFYAEEARNREIYSYNPMSEETAHRLIEQVYAMKPAYCDFGFQGGEPLLAGLSFYQAFVSYAREKKPAGTRITFTIQTNGLEIDDAFLDFLQKEKFLVGISLDGPKGIHDKNRMDNKGEGTFLRVMHTLSRLQARNMELHILTVLTNQNALQIEKLYRFFTGKGLLFQQYLPCMEPLEEEHATQARQAVLQPAVYKEALKKLFDLWFEDYRQGNYVYIRQFENWVGMLKGIPAEACAQRGSCGMQNVIEANGNVYACDFYALDKYCVGNLWQQELAAMLEKEKESLFSKEMERKRREFAGSCAGCAAQIICRGGCVRDYELGAYRYCEAYREFYRYAGERLHWLTSH